MVVKVKRKLLNLGINGEHVEEAERETDDENFIQNKVGINEVTVKYFVYDCKADY